jgi:ATP-dependent DNA ligase
LAGIFETITPEAMKTATKVSETKLPFVSKLGLEGVVSKRKDSPYRSGRSSDWLKMKNPACAAVKREAEEDWGR